MSERLRFCLIGTGRAGLIHAGNLAGRVPGASLSALCDAHAGHLAEASRAFGIGACYTDYREAIAGADIDAVVIVTPTFLHKDIACAAAAAGKHVFLEKPMAVTVTECEAIIKATEASGVNLQIGFMRRFDARFQQAKALLDTGELGRVMQIKSTGRGPGGPGAWMYDLAKSNGIVAEVNSHDIDSLHWFTGSKVRRVYAEGHNFKSPDAERDFPDFYDNVVAHARFEDDTMGVIDGACPATYGYDARVEVLCEGGVIFVGATAENGLSWVDAKGRQHGHAVTSWRSLFKDAYAAEMTDFVASIREGRATSVTGADGLEAVRVVEAINRSIRTGRAVEMEGRVAV